MSTTDPADLYLDLLKQVLTGSLHQRGPVHMPLKRAAAHPVAGPVLKALARAGIHVTRPRPVAPEVFEVGRGWPEGFPMPVDTMIGITRLQNVQDCVEDVLRNGVPGDLIETGVWRGGTTIFMRAILEARGDADRSVYVADSFAGLPPPDEERYPADRGVDLSGISSLAVGVHDVRANFARYGLLDERVRFLEGWFRDTLPSVRDNAWSVMRLDGDLYESTMDALVNLYPGLSPGGFCIVDDYGSYKSCREAVHDFRAEHGIEDPIRQIDWTGAFWQRAT